MSVWREIDGHRVQILKDGALIWEHDARLPYNVKRHMVGTKDGAKWVVALLDPLTLTPSLYCDPALGGCGRHGFISAGRWIAAE